MNRVEIESEMRDIWSKVLRLEADKAAELNDTSDFFEYGGTSLMIGIMNIMLTQRFGRTVSPEMFYDGATFGRMIDGIMEGE